MDDDDPDRPSFATAAQWASMLAEAARKDAAKEKRSATMKAKAEAAKVARLAIPALDIVEAWRRHAESCPHPAHSEEATAWFRENNRVQFDGATWRRTRLMQRSNSGKSRQHRATIYTADDGRVVETGPGANRRNDAARDWGLPE